MSQGTGRPLEWGGRERAGVARSPHASTWQICQLIAPRNYHESNSKVADRRRSLNCCEQQQTGLREPSEDTLGNTVPTDSPHAGRLTPSTCENTVSANAQREAPSTRCSSLLNGIARVRNAGATQEASGLGALGPLGREDPVTGHTTAL